MSELDYQALDPRVRTVWLVGGVGSLFVAGVAGAAALAFLDAAPVGLLLLVGCVVVAGASAALIELRFRRWRWAAGDGALELRHGVVRRVHSSVPYHRIQQIDVAQGPIEQWLGLATLVLRTAAATSDGAIPGIPFESADELRKNLLRRAGRDDAA